MLNHFHIYDLKVSQNKTAQRYLKQNLTRELHSLGRIVINLLSQVFAKIIWSSFHWSRPKQ